jgi:hypothetical protein
MVYVQPLDGLDGLAHGRWSMMDLHDGDGLLSDCLTSVRCWLGILPLGI